MAKLSTSITYGEGGYALEVYTDDDGASGYGDNAQLGMWYGTRKECETLARDPMRLSQIKLYPMEYREASDPFDMMCERRYD